MQRREVTGPSKVQLELSVDQEFVTVEEKGKALDLDVSGLGVGGDDTCACSVGCDE